LLFLLEGFLFENFRHSVDLANVIGFILTNILGAPNILDIARSNILLLIFFIASIRGYVFLLVLAIMLLREIEQQLLCSGNIIERKESYSFQAIFFI
jgi:hypothetical protein